MNTTTNAAALEYIPLDRCHPHPQNPRQVMREDVIETIAENIGDSYPIEHAILVRPVNNGYQIISGHHRVMAAEMAGLTEIPAWVREMDDDEAHMQLAASNTQGELKPLEIGIHALVHCPKNQGKKGSGRAAYAKRMGISKSYLTELCQAAEVYLSVLGGYVGQIYALNKQARYLFAERTSCETPEQEKAIAALRDAVAESIAWYRSTIDTDQTEGPLSAKELIQVVCGLKAATWEGCQDKHKHLAVIYTARS